MYEEVRSSYKQPDRSKNLETKNKQNNSQLQQSQVGKAVECPVLALLRHVVLEHGGGLRVVAVEAIEDGFDMSRSSLTLVEGDHFGCGLGGW